MKTGLITGATSGIGKAIATGWLERSTCDDDVLILGYGHDEAAAQAFVDQSASPQKIVLLRADLSDYEGVQSLASDVAARGRALDELVLNVGVSLYKKFEDVQLDEWNRILQTNLTMPLFLLQALLPNIARGTGSVVFMGSYAGEVAYSSSLVYGVSKSGLLFSVKALVKELEPYGIRVNGIAPGFIETRWQSNRSQESYERINAKIALHRFGTPDEVAKAALDVMENTYMNGSIIDIHGGYNYF